VGRVPTILAATGIAQPLHRCTAARSGRCRDESTCSLGLHLARKPDTVTNSRPGHISIHMSRDDQVTLDRLIRDHIKPSAQPLEFDPPDLVASAELIISRDSYWKGKERRLKDLIGTTMADMPPGPVTETAKANLENH